MDFVTNSLYVATIGLRVRAFCDVSCTHCSRKPAPKRYMSDRKSHSVLGFFFAKPWHGMVDLFFAAWCTSNEEFLLGSPHLTLKVSPRRRTKSSQPSCGPGCQLNKWIANDARLGSARATVKPGPDQYHSITLYTQNIIYTLSRYYLHSIYTISTHCRSDTNFHLGFPQTTFPGSSGTPGILRLYPRSVLEPFAFNNSYMKHKSSFVTHTLYIYCFLCIIFWGSINLIIHCSLSSHPISLLSHDE